MYISGYYEMKIFELNANSNYTQAKTLKLQFSVKTRYLTTPPTQAPPQGPQGPIFLDIV